MKTVITGAASGIGRAIALLFASEPADGKVAELLLADRDADGLVRVSAEVEAAGARCRICVADLADAHAPAAVIATAQEAFGGLDALISNAGAIHSFPLSNLPVDEFDRMFAVNARATLLLAQAAFPLLCTSHGSIVATVSTAGEHPAIPLGAYSASKAALLMLVRQLAAEWGVHGIRCNAVSPGPTHTAMTSAAYDDPAARERRAKEIPLARIGTPIDIARAAYFLAGPNSAYISGVNLRVDGGLNSRLGTSATSAANSITAR